MASKAFLIAVAIVATIVAPTMAKEFVVGGDNGWKLGIDYEAWTEGKEFHVGDTLVFNYKVGAHNVIKVNGTEFQQCARPNTTAPLTTGKDVIPLATPGKKWYICGISNHCETGPMKFTINVQAGSGLGFPFFPPAPSPSANPGSGSTGVAPSKIFSWIIAALAIFFMIMV